MQISYLGYSFCGNSFVSILGGTAVGAMFLASKSIFFGISATLLDKGTVFCILKCWVTESEPVYLFKLGM